MYLNTNKHNPSEGSSSDFDWIQVSHKQIICFFLFESQFENTNLADSLELTRFNSILLIESSSRVSNYALGHNLQLVEFTAHFSLLISGLKFTNYIFIFFFSLFVFLGRFFFPSMVTTQLCTHMLTMNYGWELYTGRHLHRDGTLGSGWEKDAFSTRLSWWSSKGTFTWLFMV